MRFKQLIALIITDFQINLVLVLILELLKEILSVQYKYFSIFCEDICKL